MALGLAWVGCLGVGWLYSIIGCVVVVVVGLGRVGGVSWAQQAS